MGAKWVWELITTRRLSRRYLGFFVTFFGGIALLFTLSILDGSGLDVWRAFWTKILLHDAELYTTAVGFKYVFLSILGNGGEGAFAKLWLPWWSIQAVVLVWSFFAVRRIEDYETVAYGYVLAYFLTAPTFYYQVMLLAAAFFFLPKLGQRGRTHGATLLLGVSVVGYVLYLLENLDLKGTSWQPRQLPEISSTLSMTLCYMLLLVSVYLAVLPVWERSTGLPAGREPVRGVDAR
jgi:hypothetical protein